ncbi:unnamed protein product [Gadus morhua 'NCC']
MTFAGWPLNPSGGRLWRGFHPPAGRIAALIKALALTTVPRATEQQPSGGAERVGAGAWVYTAHVDLHNGAWDLLIISSCSGVQCPLSRRQGPGWVGGGVRGPLALL